MGSCVYYAKWKYRNAKKAQEALPIINAFLKEAYEAHDYWQKNRGTKSEDFWAGYKSKFPSCYAFMKANKKTDGNCNNELSGLLSVGDFAIFEGEVDRLAIGETEVTFNAETWHMADWSPWVLYIKNYTGALKSGWLSEEDSPSLSDLIEME